MNLFRIIITAQSKISFTLNTSFSKIVELLLRSGVAVNSRDSRGRTSLHVAIEMGYDAISQLLLQHRADPNAADDMLVSPLHLAAKRGSLSKL